MEDAVVLPSPCFCSHFGRHEIIAESAKGAEADLIG